MTHSDDPLARALLAYLEANASAPRETAPVLHAALLRLCDQGALRGGVSVALDVTPDELVGPLCHALGGKATRLKVTDVRGKQPWELSVSYEGAEERWELEGNTALVDHLNDLFRSEPRVRVCAVLGEWEDMLQLWCVEKKKLGALLEKKFFLPRNRAQLASLVA